MDSAITFTELLNYSEQETKRWKEWFASHPAALDVPFPIANATNVKGLLTHIVSVELLFARAVSNLPRLSWPEMHALADPDPFAVSEDATKMFRAFIDSAHPEDWAEVKDVGFSGFKASKRKMLTQALLHGVNHRAQLSTHLRQQGFGDMWRHDFIATDVMP
ncbi:MAG: DinB family protein [Acidobacteriaceae bacterium]|jgi:uncharacterized damage-inducible protein DinB